MLSHFNVIFITSQYSSGILCQAICKKKDAMLSLINKLPINNAYQLSTNSIHTNYNRIIAKSLQGAGISNSLLNFLVHIKE